MDNQTVFSFDAIGTAWQIIVYDAVTPGVATALEQSIQRRIANFDHV